MCITLGGRRNHMGEWRTKLTADEIRDIRAFRAEGLTYRAIGILVNRPMRTVQHVFDRPPRLGIGKVHFAPVTRLEVSARVLADRDRRRELEPRDLTARLCGDPKPGLSALDLRARK
jgi:hypothetical protein